MEFPRVSDCPTPHEFVETLTCPICCGAHITERISLPYCGSEVENYLYNYYRLSNKLAKDEYYRKFKNVDYIICECEFCGAYFQKQRPGPATLAMLYDEWISSESSGKSAFEKMSLRDPLHYFSEAAKLVTLAMESCSVRHLPRLKVLDFGMGNGGFALALKACLVDVSATELANERLAFGRSLGINMLEIDASLPDNYYHLINTEQVMEHVVDPKNLLERMAGALAPGGLLKISVPHSESLEAGDYRINWSAPRFGRNSPMPLAPLEHLQYFCRKTRKVLAEQLKMKLVELPARYHIIYGTNWDSTGTIRNFGRALLHKRKRNYFLLQKV